MHTTDEPTTSRRLFLQRSGAALAMIPVVNLFGCSDDGSQRPASFTPEQRPADTVPPPAEAPAGGTPADDSAAGQETAPAEQPGQASATSQAGSGLVKLDESNPQAQALGYRHDSSEVDAGAYPRHQPEQVCANCTLYQAAAGGEPGWGGCSIFPGKLVNAEGWCSAYVAAS